MFKKSISYWSFPGGLENTAPSDRVFAEAKRCGFDAVEVCVGFKGALTPKTPARRIAAIRRQADDAGVDISSVATGMFWERSLSDDRKSVRERMLDDTKRCLDIAAALGADALLVIPGAVDVFFNPKAKVVPYDVVDKRAREAVRRLVPTAEKARVSISVENVWNKYLLSPLEMKAFVDSFKSRWVGSYFDVGNVLLTGYPEQWIEILGKRIRRIHLKDFKRSVGTVAGFCDLTEGDVNWPAVMKALRRNYTGKYLTAEMIPPAPGLLEKTSKAMDRILAM